MKSRWSWISWIIGDGMEELSFERRGDGWLFAPPLLWPRRGTYFVTDAQKAALIAPLRWHWRTQMLMILPLVFAFSSEQNRDFVTAGAVIIAAMVGALSLSQVYAWWVIRPRLAGLRETSERMSRRSFRSQATLHSTSMVVGCTISSTLLFCASLATVLSGKPDAYALIGIPCFGVLTVYFVFLLVTKLRMRDPV